MTESFKVLCQCCEQNSSDKKSLLRITVTKDTHVPEHLCNWLQFLTHTYMFTFLFVILCFSFPTFYYDLFLFSLTVYIVSLCVWLVFGPLQWMIQRKLKTQLAISLSGKQNSGMEHRLLHFYQQVSTHRGFCFYVSCLLWLGFSIFSTC